MLETIELFSSLPKETISTLELFCQQRNILAWEVLFNKWDESTSMYIVKSGLLEVYDWDKILWTVKAQEFVWEMSLFGESKVRTATVKVVEDSELIVLLWFSMNELSKKHPEIINQIKLVIEERKTQNAKM